MSVEMIGKRIAAMREEKGIKQKALATYVGVSAQAVSKWENGGAPDIELLPKIADFFSVSIDFLFGRSVTDSVWR
jgi:transcriptional regulator with XRE-family HTH domain